MSTRPFAEYRNTRLWSAIEDSLNELIATREVTVNTGAEYVIGYLCRELIAKKLVVSVESQQ